MTMTGQSGSVGSAARAGARRGAIVGAILYGGFTALYGATNTHHSVGTQVVDVALYTGAGAVSGAVVGAAIGALVGVFR